MAAGGGFSVSHPSLCVTRREEPSIKDDWMEKINDVRCCYIIHNSWGRLQKINKRGEASEKSNFECMNKSDISMWGGLSRCFSSYHLPVF